MALDEDDTCCGIIAISKTNNRITFFAVSHKCQFIEAGDSLIRHALCELNVNKCIEKNIIKSDAEQIRKEYDLFEKYGFRYSFDSFENGVPVICIKKEGD